MNKGKHFYSHLVNTESIYFSLHLLEMTEKEKQALMDIVESSVHHVIIDTVLSELPEKEKQKFMEHLARDDHDKIWQLLNKSTKDIEKKIDQAVAELKDELRKDIRSLKS